MDSHTLVKELKRFFIENKKKLTQFGLLFMLLLLAVQLVPMVTRYVQESNTAEEGEVNKEQLSNPAVFEMYIEYESGSVYTNTLLLEEAMKSEANIQAAERATGVEISDLLALEEEVDYQKTARDRGALGATRNEASNIWVVIARVGTEEENLKVAEFFFDLIVNDEIELLDNKPTYIMSEPRVLSDDELASPSTLVEVDSSRSSLSLRNVAAAVIVSIAGGFIVAFGLVLLLTFFNKKISYAFNYTWNEEDVFVLLDDQDEQSIERAVLLPAASNRVILAQDQVQGVTGSKHILEVGTDTIVEEIIVFVQPGKTEKAWYNEQRELLKVYRAPLKIIQINETHK